MEYRRFYRSRHDRMIAGICGGLGDYFKVDSTLIRLAFVFMALIGFGGAVLLAYLVMLIVVPEAPLVTTAQEPSIPASLEPENAPE